VALLIPERVKDAVPPLQTDAGPEMVPPVGSGRTVTDKVIGKSLFDPLGVTVMI
jgi:hypothetical protein